MEQLYFIELNAREVNELKKVCENSSKNSEYFMVRMYARKFINKLDSLLEKKLK